MPDNPDEVAAMRAATDAISRRLDALAPRKDDANSELSEIKSLLMQLIDKLGDRDGDGSEGDEPRPLASDDSRQRRRKDGGGDVWRPDDGDDDAAPEPIPGRTEAEKIDVVHGRADSIFQLHGKRAPMPMDGDDVHAHRLRLIKRLQHHSTPYRDANLSLINDPVIFATIEKRIYADAQKAAYDNTSVPHGQLREVKRKDQSGREISEFYGSVSATLAPFRMPCYRVTRINTRARDYD